jgi:hypothetical protein
MTGSRALGLPTSGTGPEPGESPHTTPRLRGDSSIASSSPASRPSPPGGLRPALTPAAGAAPGQPAAAENEERIRQNQVSTVSGDCRSLESSRAVWPGQSLEVEAPKPTPNTAAPELATTGNEPPAVQPRASGSAFHRSARSPSGRHLAPTHTPVSAPRQVLLPKMHQFSEEAHQNFQLVHPSEIPRLSSHLQRLSMPNTQDAAAIEPAFANAIRRPLSTVTLWSTPSVVRR